MILPVIYFNEMNQRSKKNIRIIYKSRNYWGLRSFILFYKMI